MSEAESSPDNAVPAAAGAVEAGLPVPERPDADLVAAAPAIGAAEIGAARRYAEASRAASTQRAYASDWRCFSD